MSITTRIVRWNADDATAALATQARNRSTSEAAIRKYHDDMVSGRWTFNGEAIKFDDGEHLIDGQHRLIALSRTDGTIYITFLVIDGLPGSTQMSMDQGSVRKAGQQLGMHGIAQGNTVAAGIRMYLQHQTGLLFRDQNGAKAAVITNAYIEEWALNDGADRVEFIHGFLGNVKGSDAPPSVAYCAALVFTDANRESTPEFFRILASGDGGAEHPITVLDKRLQRHRREGIKISPRDTLGLYVQAWNAWRTGKTLTKFQRPRGGHWTEATFPKAVKR